MSGKRGEAPELPLRTWLEIARLQRQLLAIFEEAGPKISDGVDRARVWALREELIGILGRELNLKRKLSLSSLDQQRLGPQQANRGTP